jgi:hypothetical protein
MLLCFLMGMDPCLRIVKLGFRALRFEYLEILSVYGEKCGGLLCDGYYS